ncbi:MAG: methyltransferase domain-containing protein [Candidatus Sericytochromatia bacterium]|nr:methyltransferase domain-containing protein [Candidatus Sericytochromatia bacterium]
MDPSALSAQAFDALADRYLAKFGDLTCYDQSYLVFCNGLKPGQAKVLDCACGPGHVAKYLLKQRPDLELLGIDLAPRMVELARAAVPSAQFMVHDCRDLFALERHFDGMICAFGLPYLSPEEALALIAAAERVLLPGGMFYLSTLLGPSTDSGMLHCSTGKVVHVYYHSEEVLLQALELHGFSVLMQQQISSPATASQVTMDLILIAKKMTD